MADEAGRMARLRGVRVQTHAEGEISPAATSRHIDCGHSVPVGQSENMDFIYGLFFFFHTHNYLFFDLTHDI